MTSRGKRVPSNITLRYSNIFIAVISILNDNIKTIISACFYWVRMSVMNIFGNNLLHPKAEVLLLVLMMLLIMQTHKHLHLQFLWKQKSWDKNPSYMRFITAISQESCMALITRLISNQNVNRTRYFSLKNCIMLYP